jgi:hypothetical protein
MDREAKRHREMEPQPEDFLMLGLDLQTKCDRRGTWASAERNFREFSVQALWWWLFFGGCCLNMIWFLRGVK